MLELVKPLFSCFTDFCLEQTTIKYATYLRIYGSSWCREHSTHLGPPGADTPKHKTCDSTTHRDFNPQSWAVPNVAAAARISQHQHLQLRRAELVHRSFTAWSPAGRRTAPRPPFPGLPPPGRLPEAGRRIHLDVAARRRAGFPLLSVRHAARLSFLHWLRRAAAQQTPERSGDAAIGCCLWGL